MAVYLLHSTVPVGVDVHHAYHYVGYSQRAKLWQRLAQHASGRGAKITCAYLEAGGTLWLVRLWPQNGRELERRLKREGHLSRHCPVCSQTTSRLAQTAEDRTPLRLRPAYRQHSGRPSVTTGGASSPGNPTSPNGGFRQPPLLGLSTGSGSGRAPNAPTPGGGASSATVTPSEADATSCVGTRRRSGSGTATAPRWVPGRLWPRSRR